MDKIMSDIEKDKYLHILYSNIHKILHMIEEEKQTGISPIGYIKDKMCEITAIDDQYDGNLAVVVVKLKLIYEQYGDMTYPDTRRKLLEILKDISKLYSKGGV